MDEKKNMGKLFQKKLKKEKTLIDVAYELFISKGVNETAIDDIVKKAGVAKGTFYLYFKDKYDIIDKIILKKTTLIIEETLDVLNKQEIADFSDRTIFFIDYIIEALRKDKRLLKLIYKNLSWGLFRKAIANPEQNNRMDEIIKELMKNLKITDSNYGELEKTLFMIIELTGSVCYSSIILEEPDNIDAMKPILFKIIRKMLPEANTINKE